MPVPHLRADEVPGSHFLRAQLHGIVQKRLELDFPVAQNVRVGGAALAVLVQKIGKHPVVVFLGKIDGVVGNVDLIADGLYVLPVLGGGAGAVLVLFLPVFHENAHHVVALLLQQQRRHRAVYAAGHADDNSFHVGHASCSQSGSSRFSTCRSTCRAISSTGWSPLTTIKRCRSLLINSS